MIVEWEYLSDHWLDYAEQFYDEAFIEAIIQWTWEDYANEIAQA